MILTAATLTFGTATLGNLFVEMTEGESHALLEAAWKCGIRSFDAAPHYGLGLAERRLGDFVRGVPRESVTVSTKVGRLLRPNPGGESERDPDLFEVRAATRRVWDFTEAGVRASCEESLERLGLDRLDTLYLHDPEESPDPAHAMGSGLAALGSLRDEGVVTRVGVGSKSVAALEEATTHEVADEVMVAGRHTLLDHSASKRLLPLCRERHVRVAAAAVYNSGLLASEELSGTYGYADAPVEVMQRATRLAAICAAHGSTLPTAALHYASLDASVTSVVIGARTPEQIRQNVDRVADVPEAGLWAELAAEGLIPPVAP